MSLCRALSVLTVLLANAVLAADPPQAKAPASPSVEQQLRQDPDDLAAWNRYMRTSFWPLMTLVTDNPDEAQRRVDGMRQFVNSLQPRQDEAKKMLGRARWTLDFWEQRIRTARTSRAELEAKLRARPDDGATVSQYAQRVRMEVSPLIYSATDRAEPSLKSARTFLDSLRPGIKEESAKKAWEEAIQIMAGLQHSIDAAKQAAKLARLPRAELEANLQANPDDGRSISVYTQKLWMELGPLAARDAARAEQSLSSAKTYLDGLRPKVKAPTAKKSLEGADQSLARLQGLIDRAKERASLVGKVAPALEVEAWVNGDPLTAEDLKGKVVLLHFWAVWFGPSIAALPRLREWHEKYADQGLVIVGLTRYFNYAWDKKAGRPIRAQGKESVAPEREREMLARFAEHHKLPYRLAIEKGDSLADYYAIRRIPYVVLIDRQGKIRLIRTGSDPRNAKDIQEMIEKLVANSD